MNRLILTILVFTLTSCATNNNLIGKWQSNEEKTLRSIRETPGIPLKTVTRFEKDYFGKLILEYDTETIKSFIPNDGSRENEEQFSYEILEETDEYYLIKMYSITYKSDEKPTKMYKENNCYYVYTIFKFKEYFCKLK